MKKKLLVAFLLAATPALAVPATGNGRGLADNQLSSASIAQSQAGNAALARRDFGKAMDAFEAALAADPRNKGA